MEEANKLIGAGKKYLVLGNAVGAASVLQEACGMLAKKFGDTADECGEAFFWCGKALLDLARMENTVLGNALEGVPMEESDEETDKDDEKKNSNIESTENVDEKTRDELRAEVYYAMSEEKMNGQKGKDGENDGEKEAEKVGRKRKGGKEAEKVGKEAGKEGEKVGKEAEKVGKEGGKVGKEAEKKVEDEQKNTAQEEKVDGVTGASLLDGENKENIEKTATEENTEEGDSGEEDEADDDDDAEEGDGEDAKSDEEEVGNLQLAWEMLELAKVIYKRKDTKEDQLLAAEAHLRLGEVASESGNYSQALEDLGECLRLQQKHLEADSRLLAETHYQLGLTHTMHCQYGPAIEHFNNATAVIQTRLDNLHKIIKEAASEEKKEMEELTGLLPELKEKVEDAQEGLKVAKAVALKEMLITAKPTNGVSSTTGSVLDGHASKAPVSDISHLVRKKRKPEESPVKEAKKVKQEESTNGEKKPDAKGEKKEADKPASKMEVDR
ncbi:hypothetical protein NHX12_004533 [Muraenolepis orangiensis]|uniref:Tetratricopeptide SHNi-TPR domain-containing protein n=1 Tax=Muraenolepis orangiensis TaxID=630683 RepID=A0A9Q0DVF7_9TELE|nr:hypothetical protein NHX12_004533 [Muraenolepis orangiensis]